MTQSQAWTAIATVCTFAVLWSGAVLSWNTCAGLKFQDDLGYAGAAITRWASESVADSLVAYGESAHSDWRAYCH